MGKSLLHMCVQCIAESIDDVPHLSKRLAPAHKELILEHCINHDMLTGARLPHITYNLLCPALTHLNLFRSDQVTDSFLRLFGQCGSQLTALTVESCSSVTDDGLGALLGHQHELITLELKKLPNVQGQCLSSVHCLQLQRLDLTRCATLKSLGPNTLMSCHSSIQYLILNGCYRLDTSIFRNISRYLINLELLDISDVHCTNDDCMAMIADGCPGLCTLNIYGCNKLTGYGIMQVVGKCSKLQQLDLSYCVQLTVPECLTSLPVSLTSLTLTGIQLQSGDILINGLVRLRNLTRLYMCGVDAVNDDTLRQTLQVLGHQLTHLQLSASPRAPGQLSDIGLEAIADYCVNLEVLLLSCPCGSYTGSTLLPITDNPERCKLIREIGLSSRMICQELIDAVSERCCNLELLDLSGLASVITDSTLISLANNCRSLHTLYMKGCNQLTDVGVCAVARSCSLKVISLSGNRLVTDQSIFTIANSCSYLEEIYLNGCYHVSPAVVRYLRDTCIPRVFTYHKLPNVSSSMIMAKNLDTGEFCRADLM